MEPLAPSTHVVPDVTEVGDLTVLPSTDRTSRRELIKVSAAVVGGVAAASYVTPSLRSLGIPVALAASGSTGNSTASCTPGYWGNSPKGKDLWDIANDSDWNTGLKIPPVAGTNPIYGSQVFSSFFTPVKSAYDPNNLMSKSMLYFASNGGTSDWIEKAARDVVAGILNSAYFGQSGKSEYMYSPSDITTAWTNAANTYNSSGGTDTSGFQNIHNTIGAQNSLDKCPL